jgi:hypothetical protein
MAQRKERRLDVTALILWIVVAALVTAITCAADNPFPLLVMFIISLLFPDDIFVDTG